MAPPADPGAAESLDGTAGLEPNPRSAALDSMPATLATAIPSLG
jgi:hypothetical protein